MGATAGTAAAGLEKVLEASEATVRIGIAVAGLVPYSFGNVTDGGGVIRTVVSVPVGTLLVGLAEHGAAHRDVVGSGSGGVHCGSEAGGLANLKIAACGACVARGGEDRDA